MQKLLTYFFCTLGIIFFFILCGIGYFWVTDPFNIRPLVLEVINSGGWKNVSDALQEGGVTLDRNPLLNTTQEVALRSVGIDPANVPSTVTPEMKKCFVSILGEERVSDIVKGSQPTAIEVIQTKKCYE